MRDSCSTISGSEVTNRDTRSAKDNNNSSKSSREIKMNKECAWDICCSPTGSREISGSGAAAAAPIPVFKIHEGSIAPLLPPPLSSLAAHGWNAGKSLTTSPRSKSSKPNPTRTSTTSGTPKSSTSVTGLGFTESRKESGSCKDSGGSLETTYKQ